MSLRVVSNWIFRKRKSDRTNFELADEKKGVFCVGVNPVRCVRRRRCLRPKKRDCERGETMADRKRDEAFVLIEGATAPRGWGGVCSTEGFPSPVNGISPGWQLHKVGLGEPDWVKKKFVFFSYVEIKKELLL